MLKYYEEWCEKYFFVLKWRWLRCPFVLLDIQHLFWRQSRPLCSTLFYLLKRYHLVTDVFHEVLPILFSRSGLGPVACYRFLPGVCPWEWPMPSCPEQVAGRLCKQAVILKFSCFLNYSFDPSFFFRFFTFFTSITPVLILRSLGCSFGPCH